MTSPRAVRARLHRFQPGLDLAAKLTQKLGVLLLSRAVPILCQLALPFESPDALEIVVTELSKGPITPVGALDQLVPVGE